MNETRESYDETIDKVFDRSEKIRANVTINDVSIAHRLPTRNENIREKPVIVRFNRRIAKFKKLQNKKSCLRTSIQVPSKYSKTWASHD